MCSASARGPGLARRGTGRPEPRFAGQCDADRAAVLAANVATPQMLSYFARLLDQRTAAPAEDLMTVLAARHADGEDRQDLLANCIFFVLTGTRPPPPC